MSQEFKLKFDEMKQGSPAGKDETEEQGYQAFASPGHVRNLCFVWPDGRMKFLNYAYLVSGEYDPDAGNIILTFTSHTVLIKGMLLERLFEELLEHRPCKIICMDARYQSLNLDNNVPHIEKIEISS